MPTIEIPYGPRKAFKPFHASESRWKVLCCHRRAGKSVAAINHLIRDGLKMPNETFAFISPTYTQGKRVIWEYLKHFTRSIPNTKTNESELRVDLPTGSRIYVLGAENPDALRGLSLKGVVFDEYSQQPPNIFGEVISPALADKRGYAIWLGTIQGKNHLWKLYDSHKADPEWFTMYLKASESGIIPQEELDVQRKNMTEDEYLQEFELEPLAAIKGAIYGDLMRMARAGGRVKPLSVDNFIPVDTYWDLGVGDRNTIIFCQDIGGDKSIVDYYEMTGMGLDHYVKVLRDRDYNYGKHWFPHDIKARELSTGRSRLEILREIMPNQDIRVVPKLSSRLGNEVSEGINAARMLFNRVYFDEKKAEALINALENYKYEWDEDMGVFRPKPLHDWASHGADAFRYMAVVSRIASSEHLLTKRGEAIIEVDDRSDEVISW